MADEGRILVAVDVDGTLLNTEFEDVLAEREVRAMEAVRSAGHVLALCTGRNLRSVNGLLEMSGWQPDDLPLVLLNGALVWGGDPHRQLARHLLTGTEIRTLVALFKEHDSAPMVYGTDEDGGVVYHERRPVNDIQDRYLAMRRRTVGAIRQVDDLQALDFGEALEVGTIDEAARIEALTAAIGERMGSGVHVINTRSLLGEGAYFWAEVFHHASDKGSGLRTLAGALREPVSGVVAIGDNFNDLDMFAVADRSVAMGNSPDEVKERADLVTGHVNEGGAAAILERIAAGDFVCRN